MEHPHTLLMLVLKQHYQDRLQVIDEAKNIIDSYKNDSNPNYEKTLGVLYQLMSDLPPDILLYFLTMVPLPQGPMSTSSTLIDLMKQMHSTNLLNNMRPTLLQYLNNQVPSVVPTESTSQEVGNQDQASNNQQENETTNVIETTVETSNETVNVQSVIDENIKKEKGKNKKKAKPKPKVSQKRLFQPKDLTWLCALNVFKNERFFKKKYDNLKKEAWDIINKKNMCSTKLNKCYQLLRDTNKKIRWLQTFKNGDVPLEVISDEYGKTDIFYNMSNLKKDYDDNAIWSKDLQRSVEIFLSKC